MMRVTALLLLTSVAIVGFGPPSAEAGAGTDGSRQIVIEEKDKDAKKAEPAKEEVKDEAPAKAEVKEEGEEEAAPAKEEAEVKEEAPAKAEAKEEGEDEAVDEKPAKVIVKEDEGKPANVIVKEQVDKPAKALVKGKEEIIVKEEALKEEPPLVIVLQTELKRVGCYHGKVDGEWGPGSSEALADFYHYGKVSISKFDPTPDALALVKGKKGVVCLAHDRPQDDYGEYDSDGGYGSGGGYSDGY